MRTRQMKILLYSTVDLPKHSPNDALNHKLFRRDQVWVFRILRFQKWFTALHDKCLEGAPTIDQCRHNLAGPRLRPVLENDNVAIADMLADHRIAAHPQRKRVP